MEVRQGYKSDSKQKERLRCIQVGNTPLGGPPHGCAQELLV